MSNGGQQVKLYNKELYRNDNNTPLRIRARTIMMLAMEDPQPVLPEKLRELYRTYPYYLWKEKSELLPLKNFYFDKYIPEGTILRVFRMSGSEPDPESDQLCEEFASTGKKRILLEYSGEEEEKYYALNLQTGRLSSILHVYWE